MLRNYDRSFRDLLLGKEVPEDAQSHSPANHHITLLQGPRNEAPQLTFARLNC
jgi:hypothetical protein